MTYYNGSELKWCTEDVIRHAEDLGIKLTTAEAENLLTATFEDNDDIMQFINDEMSDTILTYKALRNEER